MRKYILFLGLSLVLTACSKPAQTPCEGLTFHIANHTSFNFDRFEISDQVINDFFILEEEKDVCISDGIGYPDQPLVYFMAYKDGHEFKSEAFLNWCGTGMVGIDEGEYIVEIHNAVDNSAFPEYLTYTIEKK